MKRQWRSVLFGFCTIWLSGCAGIPGVSGVGYKADSPVKSWDEAKFLEVYGEPVWTHTLADGRKAAYFEYNNAFDSAGWKFVSAAAYVMTLGIDDQIGNATSKRLAAVFNPDGTAICADRVPIKLAMACDNDVRDAFAVASDQSAQRNYWFMMVDVDPKFFAPQTFVATRYHQDLVGDPLNGLERDDAISFDDEYFADLYCYAAARWYEGHIKEFRLDDALPSSERVAELERLAYQRIAARGRLLARADRDFSLVYGALQHDLNARRVPKVRNLAQRCIASNADAELRAEIHPVVLNALYDRLIESKNLAQAQAVLDFDLPTSTPATFPLSQHAPNNGAIGVAKQGWVSEQTLGKLEFRSEPWLVQLDQGVSAQKALVDSMDSLTAEATYEYEIRNALEQGLEPSLEIALSLASALSDAVVRSDHKASVRALVGLARFYLAGTPRAIRFQRAGDLFMAASFISHRLGRFDWSGPLSRFSGDAYLLAVDQILAEDGIADERSRDQLREIINFVPYSYEYSDLSGNVWEVEVRGAPIDPDRLFALITQLRQPYANAALAYAYALPLVSDAREATGYLEEQAARANEKLSSAGASMLYTHAAKAAATFDEARGHVNQMHAEFAHYRAMSRGISPKSVCQYSYTPRREAFAAFFGNPDYKQVQTLHGKWFRDRLREYDRKCKYKP
ncbi:MAG: hypothetical protein AAF578_10370 [Pseudomonadota bacterium]